MSNAGTYALRVQRVVDYLAEHLDEVLDLQTLTRPNRLFVGSTS